MKKVKRAICLLAVLVMCISLCGCGVLDDIRASRATWTEEGNIRLYDGTEYKLLPDAEDLYLNFYYGDMVYIAPDDLPLLLTSFAEVSLDKSVDGWFLRTYTTDSDGYYSDIYYCRTDVYDSMLQLVQNEFEPELCCYSYVDDAGDWQYYALTKQQWAAVEQVYTTQPPQKLDFDACREQTCGATLSLCSKDMLLQQTYVTICVFEDRYWLEEYTQDYIVVYDVPEEMALEFEEIMEVKVTSDNEWTDW